jgi:hypothetical protein
MQEPKNITIQVWTDNYYCRIIGIWRPSEEPGAVPETAPLPSEEIREPGTPAAATMINLPRYIVLSSVYEPRREVMGNNPVAPSQHPIPKEFLDDQTRQISYMFANDMGIFTPPTKQAAASFLAQQTVGYKMKKEIKREVRPATGSMTAKDLRDSLNQYTDTELEGMPVMIMGENPKDSAKRGMETYQYIDKSQENLENPIPQYITVTKITPVYELEDPYLSISPIDSDIIEKSLPPGTEDAPMSQEGIESVTALAEEMDMNKSVLEVYDEMVAPKEVPVLDEDGEPVVDEATGEPMTEIVESTEPDRIAVLEELLKKKDQELIDAGLKPAPIQTESETIPEPAEPYYEAPTPGDM